MPCAERGGVSTEPRRRAAEYLASLAPDPRPVIYRPGHAAWMLENADALPEDIQIDVVNTLAEFEEWMRERDSSQGQAAAGAEPEPEHASRVL